ncbi:hypothetical protein QTJ16_006130 [Diplocarpon rosae]|uniref:Uncharacterized protein n=1 Tax=Diplocarpon rosae TaxID=946125 RepID=A0AAD9WAG0_9HELO|nr:hypothetical protein QTJ16_006130 [Diplocarpon rosae]
MASAVARRRALRMPPRSRRTKPVISYAESSDNDDLDVENEKSTSEPESESESSNVEERRPVPRSSTRAQPTRKRLSASSSHRQKYNDESRHRGTKRRKQSKQISSKSTPTQSIVQIEGSGIIPLWQTLPYHILVQIFQYATYPLYEEHTFQPLPSGKWLLNVARLCRDFAEPAFTVLYSSPPLVPMVQAHRLVDLLMADPTPMTFKYRQKVQSLRIDVGQVVAYTLPGSGHLDLHGLVKDLPRLTDLEFHHQTDMPPYRDLDANIKWTYPDSLFEALEYINPAANPMRGDKTSICRLRSWRWSSRMGGKKYSIEKIPEIHLKPSFSSLQKVAFVNYQIPCLRKDEEDPNHEAILAKALGNLPALKHLVFEASTLMNGKLLPMLPAGLHNLEIINCWEIVADDFASFLLSHGRQLRALTLNHNQSLSLSFLPMLGPGCPKLQVFRMNLTYFNLHATYRDSEPRYDKLLEPDQIPAWPSTLQTIELIQLRKWEPGAAEVFFQSLLDSAGDLADLRYLTIRSILSIGWRDRASFRDRWVGSLKRVFKSVLKAPNLITSLSRPQTSPAAGSQEELTSEFRAALEPRLSSRHSRTTISGIPEASPPTTVRKSLIGRSYKGQASTAPAEHEPSPPPRRSTRSAGKSQMKGKYAESSDSASEASDEVEFVVPRAGIRPGRLERELEILKNTAGKDSLLPEISSSGDEGKRKSTGKGKEREVIQGKCEKVEIRIDNLRPTENQVTEADFLDEEKSGDDDWNGDDDAVEGYAW